MDKEIPKISVIIPAKNEEKYIVNTLKSIFESNYKDIENIEVVVVANGCKDKTVEKANSLKDKRIKVYEANTSSIAAARNFGAKKIVGFEKREDLSSASNEDIFVFLDADTTISKNCLKEIEKSLRKNNKTVGTLKIKPDNNKIRAKVMMGLKNLMITVFFFVPTSNGIIFCSRKMYEQLGGFDESLKQQEDGKFIRAGARKGKFRFIKNAYVISSMRRYEKYGYIGIPLYWIKESFLRMFRRRKKDYEIVR